jgi:hypothetical protein
MQGKTAHEAKKKPAEKSRTKRTDGQTQMGKSARSGSPTK